MQRFVNLGIIGEGSYGLVFKGVHKETGNLVAIKKVMEIETDEAVRKIAFREIKMLKMLQHYNLVKLFEVFWEQREIYLVFEFVEHTLLDELEKCGKGLNENQCRKYLWQVLKGTRFIHSRNVIHRDIKPENILVSDRGIVKICDFGFARTLAVKGEIYTDYVATRWYRAPELLVGDVKYGRAVDIWAIGCLLPEMLTGEPLFPGDSDIDQLYLILKCCGKLTRRHKEVFHRNPLFIGMKLPVVHDTIELRKKFLDTPVSAESLLLTKQCLDIDPDRRPTCSELLRHDLFVKDGFSMHFSKELRNIIHDGYGEFESKTTLSALGPGDKDANESCRPCSTHQGVYYMKKAVDMRTDNQHVARDKHKKVRYTRKRGRVLNRRTLTTSWSDHKKKSGDGLPACVVGSKTDNKNKSHSNSSVLQPFTHCDNLDLDKDIKGYLGIRQASHTVYKAKNKDALEVCGVSKPLQNYLAKTHLQQNTSEMNPPLNQSLEKPTYVTVASLGDSRTKQSSIMLPDIKRADDNHSYKQVLRL